MPVKPGAPVVEADCLVTGIMVGTPMFAGQCYDDYFFSMIELQRVCLTRGISLNVVGTRNESDIVRARNRIMGDFLASDCSHLIYIDSDIDFAPNDVLRLVAHNRDIVGATYAKKNPHKTEFAVVPLERARRLRTGLVEVGALPGGFMCIHRDAALQMYSAYRDLHYGVPAASRKGEPHEAWLCNLFGTMIDPESRHYWTEDYAFCRRWGALGGNIWLDPWIQLRHSGTSRFEGDPTTMFVNPEADGRLIVVGDDPGLTEPEIAGAMVPPGARAA